MQERVHLELPRAIIAEQILGQERWGPWRVNVEALTAILSLWTYNFKKAFISSHTNGEFIFVIGRSCDYKDIYQNWISRYTPENPIYINPNNLKYAGKTMDLHQPEYVGRDLPFSDPIADLKPKSEHPKNVSDEYSAHIGYQYKSLVKRYSILIKQRLMASVLKFNIYILWLLVYTPNIFLRTLWWLLLMGYRHSTVILSSVGTMRSTSEIQIIGHDLIQC